MHVFGGDGDTCVVLGARNSGGFLCCSERASLAVVMRGTFSVSAISFKCLSR